MKILFAITVVIAGIYLFLPQSSLKKLTSFMPQQQIEKAAETVLSDVDQKLEQFKIKLLMNKDKRIGDLEKKIATLESQFFSQEEKYRLSVIQHNEQALLTAQKSVQSQDITTEQLSTYSTTELPQFSSAKTDIANKKAEKAQAIKRQAYLQDLAERMNKKSLLAITQ